MRIIIDCNPFVTTSHVYYLADDSNAVSNIETVSNEFLIEHISARIATLHLGYVGLQGIDTYCEKVKEDLESKLATNYSINNVEIEVI